MEQEITLNAHNKQEYPPMLNTLLIKKGFCIILLLLYMGVLCAQDRMIPSRIQYTGILRKYDDKLHNFFDIDHADRFAYLSTPSFEPEYCLSYNKEEKSLILKQANQNIWYSQYQTQEQLRETQWKLSISDSLADTLQAMFAAAVLTSSYMGDTTLGLDGTTYQFFLNPGWSRVAECWSPDTNSNCGQAVSIMEKLCKAVRENDSNGAEGLIRDISRIAQQFRKYYPEGFNNEKYFCR